MTRISASLALLAALGCGSAGPDASPQEGPPPGPAQPALDAADAACDSLSAIGRRVLDIDVQRSADPEVENPYVRAEPGPRPGCRVMGADSTDRTAAPVAEVYEALERAGWTPLLSYMADGPDGSVVGLHRDGVLCVITGRWDGGDVSDSTYVRAPGYDVEGVCFRMEPADTADRG